MKIVGKRVWMAITTMAVIGLLFLYYLEVYIPEREGELTARKYRTLRQVAKNFNSRQSAYKTSVVQAWQEFSRRSDNCSQEFQKSLKSNLQLMYTRKQLDGWYEKLGKAGDDYDAVYETIVSLEAKVLKLEAEVQQWESACTEQANNVFKNRLKPVTPVEASRDLFSVSEEDEVFSLKERIEKSGEIFLAAKDCFNPEQLTGALKEESMTSPLEYNFRVNVSDVVGSSEQIIGAQFDNFLLIRIFHGTPERDRERFAAYNDLYDTEDTDAEGKNRCCHDEKESRDSITTVIAFQGVNGSTVEGAENKIVITNVERLFLSDKGIGSIPNQNINVSGINYKLFAHVMQHRHDEDWVLCGMVREKSFNAETRRVQLIMIIFLALILIFVLLAMPILKLLIMSSIERLQISNVWFAGFSIVVGTTVFFLFLLTLNHYLNYEEKYHRSLRELSDSVSNHFNQELNDVVTQLRSFEEVTPDMVNAMATKNFFQAGNLLQSNPTFIGLSPSTEKSLAVTLKERGTLYRYFNEVMWMNERGEQIIRIANHDVNDRYTPLSIEHRDYFKNALHDNLYPLYARKPQRTVTSFCWQSIYSWYNLTPEVGVSIQTRAVLADTTAQSEKQGVKLVSAEKPVTDSLRIKAKLVINAEQNAANQKLKVLSMATRMNSVMDPLLPPGYEFCIINSAGDVLLHSDERKNLQENFFTEIEPDRGMRSAVNGRHSLYKSVDYNGRGYIAYISPLQHQPYYLVTLFDREYYKIPIVLTFGFAFLLVGIMFLILGVQVVILFAARYEFTKLRIKRFFMSWLRPRLDLHESYEPQSSNSIKYREGYIRAIWGMVVVGFLFLALFFDAVSEKPFTLAFITLPVILLAFHYLVFGDKDVCRPTWKKIFHNQFVLVSIGMIFLIDLLGSRYLANESIWATIVIQFLVVVILSFFVYSGLPLPKVSDWSNAVEDQFNIRIRKKEYFITVILVIVSAVALIIKYLPDYKLSAIGSIAMVVAVGIWMYKPIETQLDSRVPMSNAKLHFWFLCVWLLLVSVLPVAYFYQVSYAREMQIWNRYVQWRAFQDSQVREARIHRALKKLAFFEDSEDTRADRVAYVKHTYKYGDYLTCNNMFADKDSIEDFGRRGEFALDSIEYLLRPAYTGPGPMEESRIGIRSKTADDYWSWKIKDGNLWMDLNNELSSRGYLKHNRKEFISSLIPYSLFKEDFSLLFGLVFIIMIGLIFRVIFITNRSIFGLKLHDVKQRDHLSYHIRRAHLSAIEQAEQFIDSKAQNLISVIQEDQMRLIFLVGLPYSGKRNVLEKFSAAFQGRVSQRSIRTPDPTQQVSLANNIHIIHHFEHCINDHAANEAKAKLLMTLLSDRDNRIIVSSTIQPTIILDIYEKWIERLEEQKKKQSDIDLTPINKELADLRNSYRIWKNILAGFNVFYVPLERWKSTNKVENELNYGVYLPSIGKQLDKSDQTLSEERIMEIEETAELYYHSLWNSFSQDEKHLLYDLAKDRFVNTADTRMIRVLLKKGVIVLGDTPRIMNKSFNNFILAVVKEDEEMYMTNELRRRGTWHNVQLILIIALVSIAVFIGFAQQELMSHFNTLIASIGGLLTLLLRFGGFFGGAKMKEGS